MYIYVYIYVEMYVIYKCMYVYRESNIIIYRIDEERH